MNPQMLTKVRSKLIMSKANGSPCTLRLCSFYPGYQCWGDVVGVHLPVWGKGTSTKVTDMAVAWGCQGCHDIVDQERDLMRGQYIRDKYPLAYAMRLLHGLTETHALMVQQQIILIPDGELI